MVAEVEERGVNVAAHEEEELVEAEGVDRGPVAGESRPEGVEEGKEEGGREGEEELREGGGEVLLWDGAVGVPHTWRESWG